MRKSEEKWKEETGKVSTQKQNKERKKKQDKEIDQYQVKYQFISVVNCREYD